MKKIDDELKANFAQNRHRFLANMIFTSNWFQANYNSFLKPFGISVQQMNVLRILKGAGDWKNVNEVKSLMIDKTPNTTRLSDKLLDKGYLERERSSLDRRVVLMRITKEGLHLLDQIDVASDAQNILGPLDNITEEEAQLVSDIFDKFRS